MNQTDISLTVNGEAVTGSVEPRTHLADFLREDLLLTGTHIGCEQGVCGACTVMVDGRPVRSCIALAVSCDGADVRTVEGFGDDPLMARIRDAFSRNHGLQCGYCTPGMLATVYDIVRRVPDADDDRVRRELSGNLCRCTGYAGIVAAVSDVLANDPPAPTLLPVRRVALAEAPAAAGVTVAAAPAQPADVTADDTAGEMLPDRESLRGGVALSRRLEIDAPPADVWKILRDPAAMVGCIPGASLDETRGALFTGACAIAVGPMQALFRGTGTLALDEAARTGEVRGRGRDRASRSGLDGVLDFALSERAGGGSVLALQMAYRLTGPFAQFGRPALVAEIADRLLARIAVALAAKASGRAAEATEAATPVGGISLLFGSLLGMLKRLVMPR